LADHAHAVATDVFTAAGLLKAVHAEVDRRKRLNADAGVGNVADLNDPPPPVLVLIDEFTSLTGKTPVPDTSDDPAVDDERERVIAENTARNEVGVYAGKIAREARSAGVSLVLGTQKLDAKTLDALPGAGSDVKT